jgi:hypothetical protein
MGAVREVAASERAVAVADAYEAAAGQSRLVVCSTHDEMDRVTGAIRERRKTRGELGPGAVLTRHVALNRTAAQKTNFRSHRAGKILGFHRAVKSIAKNDAVEVVRVASSGLAGRCADGTEGAISKRHTASFDVVETRPIEASFGDRLLLTSNRCKPELRIAGGELVTVSAVNATGRIQLDDGRTLPPNYRSFAGCSGSNGSRCGSSVLHRSSARPAIVRLLFGTRPASFSNHIDRISLWRVRVEDRCQDNLNSVTKKPGRSRLEPYGGLIDELRRREQTYRSIPNILFEKCQLRVSRSALNDSMCVRSRRKRNLAGRIESEAMVATPFVPKGANVASAQHPSADDVRQRTGAFKARKPAARSSPGDFQLEQSQPLRLITPGKRDRKSELQRSPDTRSAPQTPPPPGRL